MSRETHDGLDVEVRPTGRTHKGRIRKDGDPPIRSRDERESRERDGWQYTKEQLKRHEGMSERAAEAACRRARERELARKRDRGED